MLKNTRDGYGSVSKFFHWLVFLLVVTMFIIAYVMDELPDSPLKGQMYGLHKSIGLTVLGVMILRLLWKLSNVRVADIPGTRWWERVAERSVHFALYLLLIAMPLSGWIMSTAAGRAPNFFGLGVVPLPGIAHDRDFAHQVAEVHEYIAYFILALVSLHILAALWHHFIKHDAVLRRMMPKKHA
ncbi:MAG: cytochrome b [Gammaproteobacteria bacterium]